jgi:polysaccharide export outer membrane protein
MKLFRLSAAGIFFSLLVLSGCAKYETLPSGTVVQVSSPIVSSEQLTVPAPAPGDIAGDIEFRIGLGDVLSVSSPQITQAPRIAADGTTQQPGYRVYSSGKVFLPLVGGVQVSGLTIDEVQEKLQKEYKRFIKNPSINVAVAEFKSQPVYFLGKLANPGVQYLDRPVTLIQGFAMVGGIDPQADLRGARVVRENRILPIDIYQLMFNNDLRHNVQLRANDTVYIPGNERQSVFLFGAVEKQGQLAMQSSRLSLLQALTMSGLGPESLRDQSNVRIIRSHSTTSGEMIVVDVSRMITGQALDLPLQNGDVIYVPRSGIANWNQAVNDVLPSIQAVGAVLQPFVQLKYLMDDDD